MFALMRTLEIVHVKRSITAGTALRLARYFGTPGSFWMNLQSRYDLEVEKDKLGQRLIDEVHPDRTSGVSGAWYGRSIHGFAVIDD